MMGNYYGNGSMMTGGFWAWLVLCVGFVFLILIIVGIVFTFLGMLRRKPHMPHMPFNETPMEILNRRYAAGEIDKKEYDTRKKDLEANK